MNTQVLVNAQAKNGDEQSWDGNSTQAMRCNKMHPRICLQDIPWNNTTTCPIFIAQKFALALHVDG